MSVLCSVIMEERSRSPMTLNGRRISIRRWFEKHEEELGSSVDNVRGARVTATRCPGCWDKGA